MENTVCLLITGADSRRPTDLSDFHDYFDGDSIFIRAIAEGEDDMVSGHT